MLNIFASIVVYDDYRRNNKYENRENQFELFGDIVGRNIAV